MANKIEGYIGCPECKTVLFRIEAVGATHPGVFVHDIVNLDESKVANGAKNCPNVGCGAVLERVPAPE